MFSGQQIVYYCIISTSTFVMAHLFRHGRPCNFSRRFCPWSSFTYIVILLSRAQLGISLTVTSPPRGGGGLDDRRLVLALWMPGIGNRTQVPLPCSDSDVFCVRWLSGEHCVQPRGWEVRRTRERGRLPGLLQDLTHSSLDLTHSQLLQDLTHSQLHWDS